MYMYVKVIQKSNLIFFKYYYLSVISDDSSDRPMESQEEVPQVTQPPPSSTPSVLFGQRVPFSVERQTSLNRQLAPFILGVSFLFTLHKKTFIINFVTYLYKSNW